LKFPASVVVNGTGGDGVCVRTGPNRSGLGGANCKEAYPEGTPLTLLETTDANGETWGIVETKTHYRGYAPMQYLKGGK
jgi:hypothetical protein